MNRTALRKSSKRKLTTRKAKIKRQSIRHRDEFVAASKETQNAKKQIESGLPQADRKHALGTQRGNTKARTAGQPDQPSGTNKTSGRRGAGQTFSVDVGASGANSVASKRMAASHQTENGEAKGNTHMDSNTIVTLDELALAAILTPEHIEQLRRSGLGEETIKRIAGHLVFSVIDPSKGRLLLHLPETATVPVPALAFEYPGTEGYTRLRPNVPRKREGLSIEELRSACHDHDFANPLDLGFDRGEVIKYESPRGVATRLFVPTSLRPQILDASTELWLLEGEKKALAACEAGLNAVAAPGVWNWYSTRARTEGRDAREDRFEPHVDLNPLGLNGRRVIICFDSDIDTNPKVLKACVRLGQMLLREKADVAITYIPHDGSNKVGLDDYYAGLPETVRRGTNPLNDIEADVRPFAPSEIFDWLEEHWDDWNKSEQDLELQRATKIAQFALDRNGFDGWKKEAARVLNGVKQAQVESFRLSKEQTEDRITPRAWVRNWFAQKKVAYSYKTRMLKANGTVRPVDQLLRTLVLDANEVRCGVSRGLLEDAFREWLAAQDDEAIAIFRKSTPITFRPDAGDRALRAWVAAVTGKEDALDIAVVKHFVWQVKRKVLQLPVDHHMMPVLYGKTGGGKSEAVKRLLKPVDEFAKAGQQLTVLADVREAALLTRNYVLFFDEMAKAKKVDADVLKNCISSETVTYRQLGTNDHSTGPNVATFIGAANYEVQQLIFDPTSARRFWQLDCLDRVNWDAVNAIDYFELWASVNAHASSPLNDHLGAIHAIQADKIRARDAVEQWLEERCTVVGAGERWTSATACHQAFTEFQKNYGRSSWSQKSLSLRLKQLGVPFKDSNGSKYNLSIETNATRVVEPVTAPKPPTPASAPHPSNASITLPPGKPEFPQ